MEKGNENQVFSIWRTVYKQFLRHPLGVISFLVILLFTLLGIYAPFFASSKPLVVQYDGSWYFPLFRYLFFRGFFTKRIDLFFNLLMFTLPLFFIALKLQRRKMLFFLVLSLQIIGFFYIAFRPSVDPAINPTLAKQRMEIIESNRDNLNFIQTWDFTLKYMTPYAKLNRVLDYRHSKEVHNQLTSHVKNYPSAELPTLWQKHTNHLQASYKNLQAVNDPEALIRLKYLKNRESWLENQDEKITFILMPLIRHYHWEDDAGGNQTLNRYVSWWDLTRINRKDLVAALIFGIRISLVVGVISVAIAIAIGIPIGALAGYYGGKFDILMSRLVEIWESMPTFFMLLLIVAITQSKSIFLVISVIGFFGWTGFCRYTRGEFFKQRTLPYIEACRSLGFKDGHIIFSHILPNAIPPLLTLLPFAIMGAITSEAGLSFLGLGEEGSSSWGVLMDEGRTAFPGESYLLWPPAIMLTILLIAIAIVGDALRDALDPKLHRE